jgi:hypothetical protein
MPFMQSPARHLLAGVLLALCAATARPQAASLYTIEIIVFRTAGDGGALRASDMPAASSDDSIEATPVAPARLNSAARKLGGSPDFRVLAHTAWTQGPSAWPEGSAWYSLRGVSTRQVGIGDGVSGKIYLLRGRQLNLGMVLDIEEGGRLFRIREVRRNVKVDQIQYFDHPAMGVLAIVSRAKD